MSNASGSNTNSSLYNICSLEHCYTNLFALVNYLYLQINTLRVLVSKKKRQFNYLEKENVGQNSIFRPLSRKSFRKSPKMKNYSVCLGEIDPCKKLKK